MPAPLRGTLVYDLPADASRIEGGELAVTSGPGSDAPWTAFLARWRERCSPYPLAESTLDVALLETAGAFPIDALFRDKIWGGWRAGADSARDDDVLVADLAAGAGSQLELRAFRGWHPPPAPHLFRIHGPVAPDAARLLPLRLHVTISVSGACGQML